ncbi:hypothetical protein ABEB36_012654 [Hypothenemus hampei]|uniref:Phosphoprotein n=1 Tax=Hypothenemus hampei TaxID=57062 RepID=A0ABD1EBZ6_HYPHA
MNSSYYSLVDTSAEVTDNDEETADFQIRSRQSTYNIDEENPRELTGKFWRSPIVSESDENENEESENEENTQTIGKRQREESSTQVEMKKYKPNKGEVKTTTGIAINDLHKEVNTLNEIMKKCKNPTASLTLTIKNITELTETLVNNTDMQKTITKIMQKGHEIEQ